jgi:hypothetical protein
VHIVIRPDAPESQRLEHHLDDLQTALGACDTPCIDCTPANCSGRLGRRSSVFIAPRAAAPGRSNCAAASRWRAR